MKKQNFKLLGPSSLHKYKSFNSCFKHLGIFLFCSLLLQSIIIIQISIYYYLGVLYITNASNCTAQDICIILPLIISIYVLFTNLNIKKSDLHYYLSQLIILLLILKEIFYYIWKPILASIKFRLIVWTVTLILGYMGLDNNIIYYMLIFYILISLITSTYKSKNKIKHLSKLAVNLAIIITFWYYVKDVNYVSFLVILLQKNIILTFDEWDFDFDMDLTEIIMSLGLHSYCIGDPSMPPKPPVPAKLKYLVHDEDTEGPFETSGKKCRDPSKFSTWDMHNTSENNFRNFILVNDRMYLTSDLEDALESKVHIIETDLAEEKKFINDCAAKKSHMWTARLEQQSIENHRLELEWRMFQFNYEYNTLVKANTYYAQGGLDTEGNPLHHSYKDAAEGWQKRQISMWSEVYVDIYNLQTQNPFQASNTLCVKNYFNDEVAYKEVRENLFWIKLFLIQTDKVLKVLEAENRNDYTVSEYDTKIENINLDCYNEHRIAYAVHKSYKEWCVKNSPNSFVSQAFKDRVHQTFLEAEAAGVVTGVGAATGVEAAK